MANSLIRSKQNGILLNQFSLIGIPKDTCTSLTPKLLLLSRMSRLLLWTRLIANSMIHNQQMMNQIIRMTKNDFRNIVNITFCINILHITSLLNMMSYNYSLTSFVTRQVKLSRNYLNIFSLTKYSYRKTTTNE